jgi:uncharacterized repeat protein (TIGR01451 family)
MKVTTDNPLKSFIFDFTSLKNHGFRLLCCLSLLMLSLPAQASQSPAGCSANNLNVNIGVTANNVTNGTIVRWTVTVQNPALPTSCDVTLGPQGLYFTCPGASGLPTGARTNLIAGGTRIQPGYGPVTFNIDCPVNVNPGVASAQAEVTAPDSVVHKNPLRDDPADVTKTISVNIFRPCLILRSTCTSALNPSGSEVTVTYNVSLTNCGDIFLENVTVFSDQPAPNTLVFGPVVLAAGASTNFTRSYTTQNLCGPFVTGLNAVGTAPTDVPALLTATASSTCSIGYTPAITVTKLCPTTPVQPGDLLTVSGVVSNAGTIALTNVYVVNSQPNANTVLIGPIPFLPVGGSQPFTGSYSVPADSCPPYADTVRASGFALCGGQGVTNTATASCAGTNSPAIVVTKECPTAPVAPGGTLTYSFTVRNAGNITLRDVVVYSDQPSAGTVVFTAATLTPGQTASDTESYTVPADSCGPYTSTLTATGRDKCFNRAVTNSVTSACPGTSSPAIDVIKSCPVNPVAPGGTLTYSVIVSNAGNISLVNVNVYADQPQPNTLIKTIAALAPRARTNFQASYTVPVDSCGPYESTVVATGTSSCGGEVTDMSTGSCPGTNTPAIQVLALCTGDAVQPGGLLTYSGTVSNAGNITLVNVSVLSDKPVPGTVVFTNAALAPGQSLPFTGQWTVPLDSCGPYATKVDATGADKCSARVVTSTRTISCPGANTPGVSITQLCPAVPATLGGPLVFTATVVNTGNITLTNVIVVNDRPAAGTQVLRVGALAPGQSTNFSGTFTVPANLNACTITNTLNVTGRAKCDGQTASAAVTTICTVQATPAIRITKICPATPVTSGDLLTYSGVVSNAGNVTLTNILVYNDQPAANTAVFATNRLAPGATARFTASYQSPADTCSVTDTLVANASDLCGNAVSDSTTTTCPLVTTAGLAISTACPDAAVPPGGELVFTGWVTNTGNVTLTNVTIVVDRPAANTLFFGPVTLTPGQAAGFNGSFTVPTNLNSCTITYNLAARGQNKCTAAAVTANTSAACAVLTFPKVIVTKACPAAPVPQGSTLTYTGTVMNAGSIALTNIVVVNDRPASNTIVFRASILQPGQATNFTGSYVVPGNCCSVCDTLEVTAADSCSGVEVRDSSSALCPVQFTPRLTITKVCTGVPVAPGELLSYSGIISNAGNITIKDLLVYNAFSGKDQPVLALAALAPGEAFPYTSSYIIPQDFCGWDSVTVEGESICGDTPASASASAFCPVVVAPAISIVRACPSEPIRHGQPVTFDAVVVNTGNVTLTNVVVVNSMPAPNTPVFGPVSLRPGQSTNITFTYTAPVSCLCCELVDTLTARGADACFGKGVVATATTVCKYENHPRLLVVLDCPSANASLGELVTYTGTVMNQGDIFLTNVTVVSSHPAADTKLVLPITLAPGETQDFTGSYVVAANTPAVWLLTVTATGNDPCSGLFVTASENCAGSQPLPPMLLPVTVDGRTATLKWTAVAGVTYRVQSRSSLAGPGPWADVSGDVIAQGAVAQKTVTIPAGPQWYYRIMIVP